jgi:hypothetical protein
MRHTMLALLSTNGNDKTWCLLPPPPPPLPPPRLDDAPPVRRLSFIDLTISPIRCGRGALSPVGVTLAGSSLASLPSPVAGWGFGAVAAGAAARAAVSGLF